MRAYSQTTGLWLRGILAESYGVAPTDIAWTTFEGAHVAAYQDPPFVARAAPGQGPADMLRAGELDAAIVGADVPDDPGLRLLFTDPQGGGRGVLRPPRLHADQPHDRGQDRTRRASRASPRNCAGCSRRRRRARPAEGRDRAPIGRAAVAPCVRLAAQYAFEQGLTPKLLADDEIWRYSPDD